MGDEDLRALERAAASDEKARLRFAEAVLKARGPGAALRALEPLLKGETEAAGLARRRALQIAVAEDRIDGAPSPAEVFAKLFGERLASIDEVSEMIRETSGPMAPLMIVRTILVRALRSRSKRASIELAKELPDSDPFKKILGAEGEIVI